MTLEVVQFRQKKDGGWAVTRLGFAEKNDKGGIDVLLDALPMPGPNGFAKIVVQKKQERQERQPAPQGDPNDEMPSF